ncbi:hypothetical protein NEF87_004096 [Candidatus Lokiarchaeum ossiferum]|uniref:HTH arsR-type domain-containing protein n=1 Tax=Candidatus Lokiarchaeum ossiferum TaxID=2951803 RepID=A0ABY6HWQ5_9ARCH|nr:hypothetical protein NEF87_004096 [Candidatus Lokiarchaeum sp. B-35]
MDSNKKKNDQLSYEIIEKRIANFYFEYGHELAINPKMNVIYFYLLLKRRLTQRELVFLTHYSPSLISKNLQEMQRSGLVSKESIRKTNSYNYYLNINQFSFNYSSHYSNEPILCDLELINKKLQPLIKEARPGSALLSFRINEILLLRNHPEIIGIQEQIESIYQSKSEFVKNEVMGEKPIEFDPIVEQLESQVISILMKSDSLLIKNKKSFSNIFAYFYTRKILTQKKIQELSGYSIGKISEALKYLIEVLNVRIIQPSTNSHPRLRYYILDFIQYTELHSEISLLHTLDRYFPDFKQLFQILTETSWVDSQDRRFAQLYTFLHRYLLPKFEHYEFQKQKYLSSLENFYQYCVLNQLDLQRVTFDLESKAQYVS